MCGAGFSRLDPAALASLRDSDLIAMALERDQEARRLMRLGRSGEAVDADTESAALAALYVERNK